MATALEDAVPADRRTVVPTAGVGAAGLQHRPPGRPRTAGARRPSRPGSPRRCRRRPDRRLARRRRPVTSQVRLPSERPATAVGDAERPTDGTGDATAAGRRTGRGRATSATGSTSSRDGEVLRLTLGYPSGDPRLAAAARTIQRQLGVIGIEIDLLPDASPEPGRDPDRRRAHRSRAAAVPRGISDAASAASAFGCPTSERAGHRLDRDDRADADDARHRRPPVDGTDATGTSRQRPRRRHRRRRPTTTPRRRTTARPPVAAHRQSVRLLRTGHPTNCWSTRSPGGAGRRGRSRRCGRTCRCCR